MKRFVLKYWWCFTLLYLALTPVCFKSPKEESFLVIFWLLTVVALVISQVILFINKDKPKCVKSLVISVLGTLIILNIPF